MDRNHARPRPYAWFCLCGALSPLLLLLFLIITELTGYGGCQACAKPVTVLWADLAAHLRLGYLIRVTETLALSSALFLCFKKRAQVVIDCTGAGSGDRSRTRIFTLGLQKVDCFLLAAIVSTVFTLIMLHPWTLLLLFTAWMHIVFFDTFGARQRAWTTASMDRSSAREFVCLVSSVAWTGNVYHIMHLRSNIINVVAITFFLWFWQPVMCLLSRVMSAPPSTGCPAGEFGVQLPVIEGPRYLSPDDVVCLEARNL